jgi:membrane protease YdiL (CAAX protease family)
MTPRRILSLALATQAGLIVLAWGLSHELDTPLRWGAPLRDGLIGIAAAGGLAAGNHALLTRAPANWLTTGVREVYHETLVPLFGGVGPVGIVMLGAAAGIGEEWLFRGVLQPAAGVVPSTILFGLAHVGGRRMLPFGVWAMGMGLVMAALTSATAGITAATVAHGVYDMLALAYIRRGAHRR